MKINVLTENDRKVLNDARKVLRKISKWAQKMRAENDKKLNDLNSDWKPFALKYWHELDVLEAAHVDIDDYDNAIIYSKWMR